MSHRSDHPARRTSAGDPRLLALGVVLVITGVALSTCGSAKDVVNNVCSISPGTLGGEL